MRFRFIQFILIGFYVSFFSSAKAGDTLTRREVFNFSVGDTFDYASEIIYDDAYSTTIKNFYRKVITDKHVSAAMDTVAYQINHGIWQAYTDLDSPAIFYERSLLPDSLILDTTITLNTLPGSPIVQNKIEHNLSLAWGLNSVRHDVVSFCAGTGVVLRSQTFDPQTNIDMIDTQLVYLSKAGLKWGIPYTVLNGSVYVHYLPLPEECAVWTRSAYPDWSGGQSFSYIEQIRTGNKILKGGKALVELICKGYDIRNNIFFPDSLIGYFYNDTIERSATFVTDTNLTNPRLIYRTDEVNYQNCAFPSSLEATVRIDSTLVGGDYRTCWRCGSPTPLSTFATYISGVGTTGGLIACRPPYDASFLTCFSVCGETLYPKDTLANCQQLKDILSLFDNKGISVFPSPANENINVSMGENQETIAWQLMDITGRLIKEFHPSGGITTLSVKELNNGSYLLKIDFNEGKSVTKRFIVQH